VRRLTVTLHPSVVIPAKATRKRGPSWSLGDRFREDAERFF
jgi:hypothetical protein